MAYPTKNSGNMKQKTVNGFKQNFPAAKKTIFKIGSAILKSTSMSCIFRKPSIKHLI